MAGNSAPQQRFCTFQRITLVLQWFIVALLSASTARSGALEDGNRSAGTLWKTPSHLPAGFTWSEVKDAAGNSCTGPNNTTGLQCGTRCTGAGCSKSDCAAYFPPERFDRGELPDSKLFCMKAGRTRIFVSDKMRCLYSCPLGTAASCKTNEGNCFTKSSLIQTEKTPIARAWSDQAPPNDQDHTPRVTASLPAAQSNSINLTMKDETNPQRSPATMDSEENGSAEATRGNSTNVVLKLIQREATCIPGAWQYCYVDVKDPEVCVLNIRHCNSQFNGGSCAHMFCPWMKNAAVLSL